MSTAVAVKLHHARGEQLRRIAAARGLPSVVGAIEHFIAAEIAAGTIPAGLPGFEATAEAGRVHVTIEGEALPPLTPKMAWSLRDLVEHLATTRGRDAGAGIKLPDGRTLAVARKGTGILMRVLDGEGQGGETATLTFTMARDFCLSLYGAATVAEHFA